MSGGFRSWAARQFPFVMPFVLLMLLWPWAFIGLWKLLPIPRWLTAFLLLIASHLLIEYLGETDPNLPLAIGITTFVPIVLCAILVLARNPKRNGQWVDEQTDLVTGRIDGDLMTIDNYRHIVFRSLEDYDVQFKERSFDLSQLETVDF